MQTLVGLAIRKEKGYYDLMTYSEGSENCIDTKFLQRKEERGKTYRYATSANNTVILVEKICKIMKKEVGKTLFDEVFDHKKTVRRRAVLLCHTKYTSNTGTYILSILVELKMFSKKQPIFFQRNTSRYLFIIQYDKGGI